MKKYILALDQGTTSARAVVYDKSGNLSAMCSQAIKQIYPQGGWVEHDPEDIWLACVNCARGAVEKAGIGAEDIAAIGIANQRETVVMWDKDTGKPVYNAIVWQCRRTSGMCESIKEEGLEEYIYDRTGLKADPYFSATKLRWILDNVPRARKLAESGRLLAGTVDCFLLWRLTGRHCTDITNASRTMLFDIHNKRWSEDLLRLFAIPRAVLPEVLPSGGEFGVTNLLGAPVPVCGVAGDQQAALFGQCCWEEGQVKNTYGTGCFLLYNTGTRPVESKNGLVTTIAASADGSLRYALEGSVFTGGAVVQWLRDEMRFIGESADSEYYARKVPDTGGVYMVPAFTGLGAPQWDMYARGLLIGITRGTRREHIIRAALESIAYQSADLLEAVSADAGRAIDELSVDGGASANGFLMQFQSDILGIPVCRPEVYESTAQGAAYLAGLTSGFWTPDELLAARKIAVRYTPQMDGVKREKCRRGWKRAVSRSLQWAKEDAEG